MSNLELDELVPMYAKAMMLADARRPEALNSRTKAAYSPGLGPHSEKATNKLVTDEWKINGWVDSREINLEVSYPSSPKTKCDLCVGSPPDFSWVVEVKMLRLFGDNGKLNDNMLMHILSPYPEHRSAITDAIKLRTFPTQGRRALLIYGYEHNSWPMELAINAFEALTSSLVNIGDRKTADFDGLVHPVHQKGRVYGWEVW